MDVTASVLTLVQSVFILAVRLKNLTSESRAHEEDFRNLQDRATDHASIIQEAWDSCQAQAGVPYDSRTLSAKSRQIERRLKEEELSFQNDFERFEEELSKLLGEGKRQTMSLLIWGKNRVAPTFRKIETSIEAHENKLILIMALQHETKLEEIRRNVRELRSSHPVERSPEEVDFRDPFLRKTATSGSQFSQTPTLIEASSRKSSSQMSPVKSQDSGRSSISSGEKSKGKDKADAHPLLRAVSEGNVDRLETMLDEAADGQSRDKCERTALHIAMQKRNPDALLQLLLHHNAKTDIGLDVDAMDYEGKTALHYCAARNKCTAAEVLIIHHADFEIRDGAGKTALYYAINCKCYDVVKLLLDHGAELKEEYSKISTSADVQKLLLSSSKGKDTRINDTPKKETKRKYSRTFSIGSRRGSNIKA